jgi:hypothetical protein
VFVVVVVVVEMEVSGFVERYCKWPLCSEGRAVCCWEQYGYRGLWGWRVLEEMVDANKLLWMMARMRV